MSIFEAAGVVEPTALDSSRGLYRAALADGRSVALRLLGGDNDPRGHAQRDHLLRVLSAISVHPHVAGVCGWGRTRAGQSYVLTELSPEGSLATWVASYGRLPWAEVLELAVKVAGALHTAHRVGFVHGAMSADEIWLSDESEPQLSGLDLTVRRMLGGQAVPPVADDVKGLGGTMFTLLTATPLGDQARDEAMQRCDVPPAMRAVVSRCLAESDRTRPSSMLEVIAALAEARTDPAPVPTNGEASDEALADGLASMIAGEPDPALDPARQRSKWRSLVRGFARTPTM